MSMEEKGNENTDNKQHQKTNWPWRITESLNSSNWKFKICHSAVQNKRRTRNMLKWKKVEDWTIDRKLEENNDFLSYQK